jgi:hypothetical protein
MPGPSPFPRIPELAGLASYAQAARVGLSVDDNVTRLLRYHWVERRLMAIAVSRLPATPEWEVKCALALHQWQSAEHVDALRRRIAEMRSPAPSVDEPPNPALDTFLSEVLHSGDTVELLTGVYRVAFPAIADAYRRHIAATNPLVDQPTVRVLRVALADSDDAMVWGARAASAVLAGDPMARRRAEEWEAHLRAYLTAAGGIAGDGVVPANLPSRYEDDQTESVAATRSLPQRRATAAFEADMTPQRDQRFTGTHDFDFPPHVVYAAAEAPADERNLALLAKRTLEMDVPEMMASVMVERTDLPWEFQLDWSRQLWDEARHAMMGTVALAARGIDWTRLPLNVGFSLRLNLYATAAERQAMLFAIEQALMPGDTGKRSEYETAVASGDALSAHFHDYDWADEVLHARIGRRWIQHDGLTVAQAMEKAREVHRRTWAALEGHRGPPVQGDWWDDFVRRALGRPSALTPEQRKAPPEIIPE